MELILAPQAIKFDYFSLYDYVEKFKLSKDNLDHAKYLFENYTEYMNKIKNYDSSMLDLFLIYSFNMEIKDSNLIESHLIYPEEVLDGDYYIDNYNISSSRIKKLHGFSMRGTGEQEYRTVEAWVQFLSKDKQLIHWYGAKPEDIDKFISDFINIYKDPNVLDYIFIKSSLIHLLFTKIHPFKDGNGRTARLLTNMKFSELTNKLFDVNFKISPLHLSHSIYRNIDTYYARIDSIYFDLDHEINEEVNRYFKYMLDMYDEQLFYMDNLFTSSGTALSNAALLARNEEEKREVIKNLVL